MSRILIHQPSDIREQCVAPLALEGQEVVTCTNRRTLVDALSDRRPDVLVYVIANLAEDLALLAMLRQVAPTLPFILLGGPTDLTARRSIQELKPTYYGVFPLEGSELNDAVRGALQHGSGRR